MGDNTRHHEAGNQTESLTTSFPGITGITWTFYLLAAVYLCRIFDGEAQAQGQALLVEMVGSGLSAVGFLFLEHLLVYSTLPLSLVIGYYRSTTTSLSTTTRRNQNPSSTWTDDSVLSALWFGHEVPAGLARKCAVGSENNRTATVVAKTFDKVSTGLMDKRNVDPASLEKLRRKVLAWWRRRRRSSNHEEEEKTLLHIPSLLEMIHLYTSISPETRRRYKIMPPQILLTACAWDHTGLLRMPGITTGTIRTLRRKPGLVLTPITCPIQEPTTQLSTASRTSLAPPRPTPVHPSAETSEVPVEEWKVSYAPQSQTQNIGASPPSPPLPEREIKELMGRYSRHVLMERGGPWVVAATDGLKEGLKSRHGEQDDVLATHPNLACLWEDVGGGRGGGGVHWRQEEAEEAEEEFGHQSSHIPSSPAAPAPPVYEASRAFSLKRGSETLRQADYFDWGFAQGKGREGKGREGRKAHTWMGPRMNGKQTCIARIGGIAG
ncbi:hypothetical protein MKZ38_006115 [Zalerion maritima]|uniref:Uncharacterized protein n=1 Tax=Zalerion maritima TaxID=339359 RepID=A0AAD5S3N5_9PEZI|nr:hypothetical protein MKZ38_006115 [Zalerion maritima]